LTSLNVLICHRLNPCLPPVAQGPVSVSSTAQGYPTAEKTCSASCPPVRCNYQRHRPVIGNKALLSQFTTTENFSIVFPSLSFVLIFSFG